MNTETKTLTAQEFALFIGQEVTYPDTDGKTIKAKLTGISGNDGLETTYKRKKDGCSGDCLSFKPNGHHNCDALHTKLILRPLSDMTQAEHSEFEQFTHLHNASIEEMADELLSSTNPHSFKYALSRGFDLFNWIEHGKAIKKV